jgi:uncharacterized membrane protein
VSIGSGWIFGDRFIFFGILHFVAVALIIARLLVPLGRVNLVLGIVALLAGLLLKDAVFDTRALTWIGFATRKPLTEDYVPLFPWLGVTLIGVGLGALWQRAGWPVAPALRTINDHPPRWLLFLGTWSLTIYLVHQPILLGLLWLINSLTG